MSDHVVTACWERCEVCGQRLPGPMSEHLSPAGVLCCDNARCRHIADGGDDFDQDAHERDHMPAVLG